MNERQGCRVYRKQCFPRRGWCRCLWFLLLAIGPLNQFMPVAAEESAQVDCQLQLLWKSEQPRVWAGQIAVVSQNDLTPLAQTLCDPKGLCTGMLYSGGIRLNEINSELHFAPSPSASHLLDRDGKLISLQRLEGGVGFRVKASLQDRVVIWIEQDNTGQLTKPVAVPIGELLDGRSIQNQFSQNASWTLRRIDGDRLRVAVKPVPSTAVTPVTDNSTVSNLLWDNQSGQLSVVCDVAGDQTLELTCELYRDHKQVGAKQRWTVAFKEGKATVDTPSWQPPPGDGSYEAVWRLSGAKEPKSVMGLSIPNAIGNPMSIIRSSSETPELESRTQVFVIARQPEYSSLTNTERPDQANMPLTDVGRIEPFGRSWSVGKMLPIKQASQLVGVTNAPDLVRRNVSGVVVGEIARTGAWEHGLPVGQIGRRHRIQIVVPSAMPMKLGVILLDQGGEHTQERIIRDYTYIQGRLKSGDDEWKTIEIDFYPQSSSTRVRLEDRGGSGPVMFQHIEVQQADDFIAFGSDTPRQSDASGRTAWLQMDASTWLERFGSLSHDSFGNPAYVDPIIAAERLVSLMRRNGMNGLALTVNQDGRAFYPTKWFASDQSAMSNVSGGQNLDELVLPILLQILDREQVAFLPCIRLNTPLVPLEQLLSDAGPESVGITPGNLWTGLSLDLSLQQAARFNNLIYNPLHPAVGQACNQATDELTEFTADHDCVRGIGMLVDQGSVWQLPPVSATMDATTLDRFYAALPSGTVARSQLIGWIQAAGEQAFENWRRAQLHSIYLHAAEKLRKLDRQLVVLSTEEAASTELAELVRIDNIRTVGLVRRSPLEPLAVRCRDESVSATVTGGSSAKNALPQSIFDTALVIPSTRWSADKEHSFHSTVRSLPIVDWSNQSLLISRLLNKPDHRSLFFDANLLVTDEPILARSLQEWIALPEGEYEDQSFATEQGKLTKVRTKRLDTDSMIIALINPSRWHVHTQLNMTGLQAAEPLRKENKDRVLWSPEEIQVALAPGELLAIKCIGSSVAIVDCATRTVRHEEDLVQMSEVIRALAERLALITEPNEIDVIDNPGFEAPSAMEAAVTANGTNPATGAGSPTLAGWMVAQYPLGCVSWDREFVYKGAGSARLRNSDGRAGGTWMVSRAFPAPTSGRVAVSVMLRGEPSSAPDKSPPIKVRLSIEGTVAHSNLRESVVVQVPRDGKWSTVPYRVEIDELPACGVDSLRFAVDVMNEGAVWIDEVCISDHFMTDPERNHLQSQMYLAMGAIPKGDLMAAAKLLESHWIQELLAGNWDNNRPAILNTTDHSAPVPEAQPPKVETPGIADRFKSWLPKPMRY